MRYSSAQSAQCDRWSATRARSTVLISPAPARIKTSVERQSGRPPVTCAVSALHKFFNSSSLSLILNPRFLQILPNILESAIHQVAGFRFAPPQQVSDLLRGQALQVQSDGGAPV